MPKCIAELRARLQINEDYAKVIITPANCSQNGCMRKMSLEELLALGKELLGEEKGEVVNAWLLNLGYCSE